MAKSYNQGNSKILCQYVTPAQSLPLRLRSGQALSEAEGAGVHFLKNLVDARLRGDKLQHATRLNLSFMMLTLQAASSWETICR